MEQLKQEKVLAKWEYLDTYIKADTYPESLYRYESRVPGIKLS